MVGVWTPLKSANVTNHGFPPCELVVRPLPAHRCLQALEESGLPEGALSENTETVLNAPASQQGPQAGSCSVFVTHVLIQFAHSKGFPVRF